MNTFYLYWHRLCLIAALLGFMLQAQGQSISNYVMDTNSTSSLNRTYGSLIDDIDMNSGTTVYFNGGETNRAATGTMPFDFFVYGNRIASGSTICVTSSGWLSIGGTVTASTTFGTNFFGAQARFAPFLGSTSSQGTSSIGRVHSKVVGTQPYRVLVVEYLRMAFPANVTNDTNIYQVRLYESTGAIEYVYGRMKINGSASQSYNVGIHLATGFATNSVYQNLNTSTFTTSQTNSAANTYPAGEITELSNRVPGQQRGIIWIPSPPDDPGSLSFSSITANSMIVNWSNNGPNDLGFAVYRSTDQNNYTFAGFAGANSSAFYATGLIANTQYFWRVYAYRESISYSAEGDATTLPATKFYTIASGNWNDGSIWNTTTVPGSQDSAEISAGHTVTLNQFSQTSGTLIVKGRLDYGTNLPCSLNVNGNVIVESTGTFTAGTSTGGLTTNLFLNIGGTAATTNVPGSFVIDGLVDFQTTNNVLTTFFGSQNATVTGSSATEPELPFILCNKGTDTTTILDFQRTYTQASSVPSQTSTFSNQRLMVSAGTLKISAPVVTNSFFGTQQLAYASAANTSARLWLNHNGISLGVVPGLNSVNSVTLLRGEVRIDAGSITTGTGSGAYSLNMNSIVRLNGGTMTHNGYFNLLTATSPNLPANLVVAGGNLVLDPQTSLFSVNSGLPVLNIAASTDFTFTSGTITIVDPHDQTGTATSVLIGSGGVKNITGGTFILGTTASTSAGASPASTNSGFGLNIAVPIHNLTINNNAVTVPTRYCRLQANLTLNGILDIKSNGYLTLGNGSGLPYYIYSNGNVINNGVISGVIPGGTTRAGGIVFSGTSAQTVSGSGTGSYLTTTVSNTAGVTFSNTGSWVMERFTLEKGNVSNSASSIHIGSSSPAYAGTIVVGGLNETTAAGSFATLPTINGTPSYIYGPASNTLTTGSFNEMGSGAQTVQNLTVNDAQGISVTGRNISVTGTLALTEGNLDAGSTALSLGVSTAAPGTLTRVNGNIVLGNTGTFGRWFSVSNPSYSYTSGFPLSTGSQNRSVLLSMTGGFLQGYITVGHNSTTGYTDLTAPGVNDQGITVDRRTNASWTFTPSNMNLFGGTLNVRIIGSGIGALTNVSQLTMFGANAVVPGTRVAGSGDVTTPEINRSFTQALFNNLSGIPVYIGTTAAVNPLSPTITAINTGNWNSTGTWDGGIIPTITNNASIAPGVTVTIPASYTAMCNGLTVSAGATVNAVAGTLNNAGSMIVDGTFSNSGTNVNIIGSSGSGIQVNSGGTLGISAGTINVGPNGGGNRKLLLSGTLNVSGGTLTVNGSIGVDAGAAFNQSAGDINIDPNDGTAAGSVSTAGEHALLFSGPGATTINCSGGIITIVDPPYPANMFALRIQLSAGSMTAFSGTHTLRLGNGTSTNTSVNTNGFILDTKRGTGRVPLQNVIVNGGSGTNRWVSDATGSAGATHIKGDVTITTGSELRHTTTNSNFAIGGNITNNGTMTMAAPLILGGEGYVISNAQTIDGSGTFRNSVASPTGAFTVLNLNNGTGLTLNTNNVTFAVTNSTNALLLNNLKITTNSNTIVTSASGLVTGGANGYIVGNLGKVLAVGSSANYTYEIGSATDYLPVNVNAPVVSNSGVLAFGVNSGAHPQLNASCINPAKRINRYWKVNNNGVVSTGGNYIFNFLNADVLGGANLAQAKTFAYNGTNWTGGVTGSGSANSYTLTGLNLTGDIAVGEITPVPASVTISATPSGAVCAGTSVQFTAAITNGGTAPAYQWKLNGSNVATTATYTSSTLANGDVVTCEIVSNDPCVAVTGATSNSITMTVDPVTAGGDVTGGTAICSGSTSGVLRLAGHTGTIQRWQYAVSPFSTWVDTAITTSAFTSGPLTQTTRYRAVVKSGACAEAFSDTTAVIVNQPSAAPIITGNTTICSGSNAGNLTLPVTGTVGTIVRWESATNAAFTANLSTTVTSSNIYAAGSPAQTTYYRAIVKNGTCAEAASPTHTVTVNAASVGGSVSSNQTICAGGTVAQLSLSGQTGTVTKWQSSSNSGFTTPTDIVWTGTTYTPSAPSATTYYRAVVSNAGCTPANSASALITVNPAPGGGTISGPASVCSGSNPGTLQLQSGYVGTLGAWQYQTAATAPAWTNTGTTGTTQHNPGALTVATKFRVQLTNPGCTAGYSNEISIAIDPSTVGGTVSGSQTICAGGSVTGFTLGGGYVGTVQRWESSTDAAFTSPTTISNTTTTYTPSSAPGVTTYYRAIVKSGSCAEAASASASITVTPATVGGTVSGSQTICAGGSVTGFTLGGGYVGTVQRWESSTDAVFTSPTTISNTTTTYTPSSAPSTTTYYRAIVKSGSCAEAASASASITVTPATVGGTVSGSQTICAGGSVTGFTLGGGYVGTVQRWESSTDAAFTSPTTISNTTTTYTPSSAPSTTTYYRAIVKSGSCAEAASASASITVTPATVGGTVSGNQTICAGGSVTAFTLGGGYVGTVQRWESSTDAAFTSPTTISNTTTTYTPSSAPGVTTYYRAIVKSGSCAEAASASASITVTPATVGGTVSGSQTICAGGSVTGFTLGGGYVGTVQRWESSTDAAFTSPTTISNTTTTYTPSSAPGVTTYYRAIVKSGSCAEAASASASITVTPATVGGTVSGNQTICAGGSVTGFTLGGGYVGTVQRWESSTDAAFTSPTTISNTTTTYTPSSAPSTTTYYRAIVKSGSCAEAASASASITVTPATVGGTVSGSQTICAGGSVTGFTLGGGYVGTVQRWESSTDAAFTSPTTISNTTTTYTPSSAPSTTTYYRAIVKSGSCAEAASASASITVTPATVGGTVSGSQTICAGGSVTGFTLGGGYVGTVQRWESSTDAAFTSPTTISNTTTTYTPSSAPSTTTYYRAIVKSGSCAEAASASASIIVTAASVGGTVSSPTSSVCSGSTSGLLTSNGRTGNVINWLSAIAPFDTYTAIPLATGNTFTSGTLSSTTRFRVLVQSGSCTADTSSYFEVTVNNAASAGTLVNNGASAVCQGGTGPSLQLNGYSGTIQKWESAYAPGFVYSDISAQTSASYATGTLNRTTRYRVTVNNPGCTAAVSNEITITVDSTSLAGTATTSSTTICSGSAPAQFSLTGTVRGSVTRWDSTSTSPYNVFSAIPSSAGSTYSSPALTATTHFRAVVQNGVCPAANSVSVAVTIAPASDAGTLTGSTPICSNSQANLQTTGTNIIRWEENSGSGWGTAGGTFFPPSDYLTGTLTATTKFRAIAQAGFCAQDTSNEFEVVVSQAGLWTGLFNSNWSFGGNWCPSVVPTSASNVVIPAGTLYSPKINTAAVANNVTVEAGASLEFTGTSNKLTIGGNLVVNGSFNTANGTVVFDAAGARNIAGIIYDKLEVNGTGVKTLTGNAIINGSLSINSAILDISNYDLTLNGSYSALSALSYIATSGTGTVKRYLPLATAYTFPVGNGSYTPLVITNNGTSADTINVRIMPKCYDAYSGFTGTSAMVNQKVVDRTFVITESTPGGSLLDIQFNWNNPDVQNAAMDKTQMVVGHYTTTWNHATTTPQNIGAANQITLAGTSLTGLFAVGDVTSPLPVRLLSFTAKLNKGITTLNWSTASETNNSHFEVERGTDGYNFEKIGRIEGKGNTIRRIDYLLHDADAGKLLESANVLYYRLKQYDFNGDFDFSSVVSVSEHKNTRFDVISTVPNPFVSTTTVTYKTTSTTRVDIVICDAFGKTVSSSSIIPVAGANTIEAGVDNQWAAGVYFVKLTQDNTMRVVKIVKE